jgi:GPI mannosyltransferase 2
MDRQVRGNSAAKTDTHPVPETDTDTTSAGNVYHLRHPRKTLAVLFLAWKTILFAIVANCPGLGYDTSTSLLIPSATAISRPSPAIWNWVRWDAIYFVRVAERGYLFEQEWAWGYGWTRLLKYLGSGIQPSSFMKHMCESCVQWI